MRGAQLQDSSHTGLKGIDVQLELRAQDPPHIEHDAACAVDAAGVQRSILIVLPVFGAEHLHPASLTIPMLACWQGMCSQRNAKGQARFKHSS